MSEEATGVWLEEYQHCGCSTVAKTRQELLGYCEQHGNDRRRVTKLPAPGLPVGFAGIG